MEPLWSLMEPYGALWSFMDWDSLMDCQGAQSQKEAQEDQGTFKQLGGAPPSSFISTWSSWPSFWLFPGPPDTPSNWLKLKPVKRRLKGL